MCIYLFKRLHTFIMYFNAKGEILMQYIIFFRYKRPDGSQLQPKHVAVTKLIKLVLCMTLTTHTRLCCPPTS
jgi:hypothetical protein